MSGVAHSFERLVHSNVGKGVLAAVAAYYVTGLASGSFDGTAPGGGDESAGLNTNPSDTSTMDTSGSNGFGGTTPLPMPDNSSAVSDAATGMQVDNYPTQPPDVGGTPPDPAGAPPAAASPAPQSTGQPAPSAPVAAPGSPDPATGAAQGNAGLPPVTDLSKPAPSSALGNLGVDRLTATSTWFKNLSPAAQAALMGGVAGGAGALMTALSQKHAQEFQVEQEQRHREDIQRRGKIPAFSDTAITPNGGGIINAARGGR